MCLGLDVAGDDGEWSEDGKTDLADIGAAARDDEVLVERREGELAGASCQERQSRWDLVEKGSIISILLAFLAND